MSEITDRYGNDDYLTTCDVCRLWDASNDMRNDWDKKSVCPNCVGTGYFKLGQPSLILNIDDESQLTGDPGKPNSRDRDR